MWYLQTDTFILLAAFSLIAALLRRVLPHSIVNYLLPCIQIAALAYISYKLAAFFVLYTAASLLLAFLLAKYRRALMFALSCLLSIIPFILSRTAVFGVSLPFVFSIGLAFHILRAIDVYYHVYYGGEKPRPLAYINYMLFLPVFTAGPVFRYRDFLTTYDEPLPVTSEMLGSAFRRIIRGFFKKIVLAETALFVFHFLLDGELRWYGSVLTVMLSYTIIYLDLSGYSDISIAFGRIAGYDVPENFKKPLTAASFTQFWRSWHSTLSDWIREHVYILIAKKRPGKYVSGMIALFVMILMSLWHGFHPMFVIAGVYNGLLLMLENFFSLTTVSRKKTSGAVYVLRCIFVNFAFGLNTLVFLLDWQQLKQVLLGFISF